MDLHGRAGSFDPLSDVVATVGPLTLATAEQWLLGRLLLWAFVVPSTS